MWWQSNTTNFISIHALLAESDPQHEHYNPGRIPISIHALLAESDCQRVHCGRCPRNFYPRSPCGERQYDPELYTPYALISIHALLAESDQLGLLRRSAQIYFYPRYTVRHSGRSNYFYPRSPCGERHWAKVIFRYLGIISIHALLAESDIQYLVNNTVTHNISIHALLAESDIHIRVLIQHMIISIHALLAESDIKYRYAQP